MVTCSTHVGCYLCTYSSVVERSIAVSFLHFVYSNYGNGLLFACHDDVKVRKSGVVCGDYCSHGLPLLIGV